MHDNETHVLGFPYHSDNDSTKLYFSRFYGKSSDHIFISDLRVGEQFEERYALYQGNNIRKSYRVIHIRKFI